MISAAADNEIELPPPASPQRGALAVDATLGLLARMFGVDLRSLAAFRMVLGLVMLFDLLGRWSDVAIHYSDRGLLPRPEAIEGLNTWRWSLYFINGSTGFAHVLFALTAVVTVGVIVGYRTRWMTVALWILLASLQVRNPLVLSGADSFLRVLAFWAMFLPLGAVWSVDRWRERQAPPPRPWYASMSSAALLLQIAFVYFFTALLKTDDAWRVDFNAVWYALGAEQLTTPFGAWLHDYPNLLQPLTVITMVVEFGAPIILFIPWRNAIMRCLGIVLIVGLQLGIMVTMNIGIFPWISALCMVCFLPTVVWSRGLAFGSDLLQRRLPWLQRRWQHAWGTGAGISDTAGRAVRGSLSLNVVTAVLLVGVLGWNIASVSSYTMPTESRPVMYSLGLYQRWAMFAPRPPRSTQWTVVQGTLANDDQVSLLEPLVQQDMSQVLPLTWERPAYIGGDYYGDKYWRKYFAALDEEGTTADRRSLAGYLCRHWNDEHDADQRLTSVTVFSVLEATLPDGEVGEQRRIERSHYTCA